MDSTKGEIRLLSIAPPDGAPALFDLKALGYTSLPWSELFNGRELIAHNAAFELEWFAAKLGAVHDRWYDTYIAAKLLGNGDFTRNDLGNTLHTYLGVQLSKELGKSDWGGMFITDTQAEYALNDVIYLDALRQELDERPERQWAD